MRRESRADIDPRVVALTGERWAQAAATALDRGSDGDDRAVLGYLDSSGDLHRVSIVRQGGGLSVKFTFDSDAVGLYAPG